MTRQLVESGGCRWEITARGQTLKVRLIEGLGDSIGVNMHQPAGNVVTIAPDSYGDAAIAAPDMLHVLKRLDRWFDTDAGILDAMSPDDRADHERQHRAIRDVIAKAERRE